MFTYTQTQTIHNTAKVHGLDLWEATIVDDRELRIIEQEGISSFDTYYGESDLLPALTLDNLITWLTKTFGGIENIIYQEFLKLVESLHPEERYIYADEFNMPKTLADKLIQQATTQYFDNSQALTDDICEAITTNF
jgi:hypothetical protein